MTATDGRVVSVVEPESQGLWTDHTSPELPNSLNLREKQTSLSFKPHGFSTASNLIQLIPSTNIFVSFNYIFVLISLTTTEDYTTYL